MSIVVTSKKMLPIADTREMLTRIIKEEIEQLPEILKQLAPEDRLNILCRLIPFVMPKIESSAYTTNEPTEKNTKWG